MEDLKIKYEYINFVEVGKKPKTTDYSCRSNRDSKELGFIMWYCPWRQYCFFPAKETIFNKGCLEDIQNFLEQLRDNRKDISNV